jgi:hypothetical protein
MMDNKGFENAMFHLHTSLQNVVGLSNKSQGKGKDKLLTCLIN